MSGVCFVAFQFYVYFFFFGHFILFLRNRHWPVGRDLAYALGSYHSTEMPGMESTAHASVAHVRSAVLASVSSHSVTEVAAILDNMRARPAPWAFRVCAYTLSKVFGLSFEKLVRLEG